MNLTGLSGNMKIDTSGLPIVTEPDIINLMYQGTKTNELFVDDKVLFEQVQRSVKELSLPLPFTIKMHSMRTLDEMTNQWRLPDNYIHMDIESWFANKIKTEKETRRVASELALYRDGGLYPLLKFLIYLVDLMREKKIVWGVGRGSSVSSYCLFLIGIHKIDSMKYNLEIKEFLKWQDI